MTTRLAFTLTPLPGEPFALWWHTYATRLQVTTRELATALAVADPPQTEDIARIAASTGLPTTQLAGLFVSDQPDPPRHVLHVWTALTQPASDGDSDGDSDTVASRIVTLLGQLRDPNETAENRGLAQDTLTDLTLIALHLTQNGIERLRGFTHQLPDTATLVRALELHDTTTDAEPDRDGRDPLAEVVGPAIGHNSPAVPFSWRTASPTLQTRIARARDQAISPADRLRYATTLPHPKPAARSRRDPAIARAAKLPDQIWSAWALRLVDDDGVNNPVFRASMSVALLRPHSGLTLKQLAAILPTRLDATCVGHQLRRLNETLNGSRAVRVLTELALALDEHPVPIDYPRRRALAATSELIDQASWQRYCRDAGLRPGYTRRLAYARRYLYELLTGGSLAYAPRPYQLAKGQVRVTYVDFWAALPANLVHALHEHARGVLTAAGITGEPTIWEPPTDWVDTTDWPGIDPDQTEPDIVHDAMRQQWAEIEGHFSPTHATAAMLGISLGHLRHVLRNHPVSTAPYSAHRAGTILAVTVTPGGPGHDHTRRPHDRKPVFHVDLDWLCEQLRWGRSLNNIATEIGCSRGALSKFATAHGIAVRPRSGGPTCIPTDAINCHPSQLPELLRTALTGPRSLGRIERFLFITGQPSLNQASIALGLSQGSLTMQLHTLERICGGQLLHRPPRPQPVATPTSLGEQLCQQAREYLVLET
jgi:hypothetical protein